MPPRDELPYILADCFLAVGQTVGSRAELDPAVITWWHARYHEKFLAAMTQSGNSWACDRERVTAVGRYLGTRVLHHSCGARQIDLSCAARASADVESGCRMKAQAALPTVSPSETR